MEVFIEHSILDDEGSHHFSELLRHLFGHQVQERLPTACSPGICAADITQHYTCF